MADELKMPESLSHIDIDSSHPAPEPVNVEEKKPEVKAEAPVEKPVVEALKEEPVAPPVEAPTEPMAPAEPAATVEPAAPTPEETARQKEAQEAIEYRMRAEAAEAELKKLQPKANVPEKEPDINDQTTWGEKYKDATNDLDTFLKAHTEWAQEQGRNSERAAYQQQEEAKKAMATRVAVAQKEQESRAKHADYDTVVNPIVPVIAQVPILKDFIAKNPMGTEVIYELAKNPTALRSLLQSDVWVAGEQLLGMASRLKNAKPTKTITNAPAPITPVGSNERVGQANLAELASTNIAAFMEKRKADALKRAKMN